MSNKPGHAPSGAWRGVLISHTLAVEPIGG